MHMQTNEMKSGQPQPSNLWSKWRDDFTHLFKTAENLGNEAAKQRSALQGQPVASQWESLFKRVALNNDAGNQLTKA